MLSLLGPALLGAAVLASARWTPRLSPGLARRAALGAQLALVAFAALCFLAQYDVLVSAYRPFWEAHVRYFTLPTLALALAAPPAALALLRQRADVVARVRALARETPPRRTGALVVAILFTAIWMLTAVDADGSLANTATGVAGHILWSMDEPFAILDGRTPLVELPLAIRPAVAVRRGRHDGAVRRLGRRRSRSRW